LGGSKTKVYFKSLFYFSLTQRIRLFSFLWLFPFFSLAQRKETKENIGCKLFAINSALR
jgi:hypothetical protein